MTTASATLYPSPQNGEDSFLQIPLSPVFPYNVLMANILDLREQTSEDDGAADNTSEIELEETATPKPPQQIPKYISWETYEFNTQPKPRDWYVALGILTVGLLVVAFIMRNVLFGVFVGLAGFTLALFGAKKPRIVDFAMSANGVHIAKNLHPFDSFKSFWVIYNPPISKEIVFVSKNTLSPILKVPLGEENPLEVRAFLLQFLPEKQFEESLIDMIAKYLRF